MHFKLTLVNTGRPGPALSWLLNLPTTVGRGAEHGICVNHDSISRTHCRFALNGEGALTVRDLNSMNGTYVNDQRVQHALLTPGDQVQLGAVAFRVELAGVDDLAEPAAQPETYDLSSTVPMQPVLKRGNPDSE